VNRYQVIDIRIRIIGGAVPSSVLYIKTRKQEEEANKMSDAGTIILEYV